jgi:hypothetical protein
LVVAANNYNVYVLCAMDQSIQEYARTPLGGLDRLSKVAGLPKSASGMAAW